MENNFTFFDLFDIVEIQSLQDLFADANGVASIITKPDGTPITKPSNFCRLCIDIIRKTEKGCSNCFKSDAILGVHNTLGPTIQPCLSGGLWDSGVSITVGDTHIANWLIGQVRNESIDLQKVLAYADEIGADRDQFMEAYNEVTEMSLDKFTKVSKMLFAYSNQLSSNAYNNYLLKKKIKETEKTNSLLQTNKDKLHSILQTAMDGFWIVDFEGKLLEVNNSYSRMSGYSIEELLTLHIKDLEVNENQEEIKKRIHRIKTFGEDKFETQHKRKDGSLFNVEANVQFQKFDEGRLVVFMKDITERKNAENELNQSQITLNRQNEILKSLLENLQIGVFMVEAPTGKPIIANKAALNLLGRGILPDTTKSNLAEVYKAFKVGTEIPYPIDEMPIVLGMNGKTSFIDDMMVERPDGSQSFIEIFGSPVLDSNNTIWASLVSFNDITKRRQTEEELGNRGRFIESLINVSPDIIYLYDLTEQKNIFTNNGITKILGYSLVEIQEMGNTILQKLMYPHDFQRYLNVIIPKYYTASDSDIIVNQYRMIDKQGKWHWIESTETIYKRNADNSPKQIFGTGRNITESKQNQEALLEAEWKFKALFEKGPIGVAYHEMIYDETGKAYDYRFIDANEAYLELTGVDPRGKTVLEAFPGIENDTFDWIGTFGQVAKTGITNRFETYLQANNRWYDCVGYQYKPDHFVAAFVEITKRKKAEQALKESQILFKQNEERLTLALTATTDALWEWNYVTGQTYYTERWYQMLGYENQEFEMSFETFEKLCHPDDFKLTIEKISSVLDNPESKGYNAEFRMLHKNGSWIWIMGRGNVVKRDENLKPLQLSGTNTDITSKKEIENALKESEEKFRNLVRDMQIGVMLQGPKAEIILTNPKALELLGLTEDQLLGKTSFDPDWNVIHEDGSPFPGNTHPVPQAIASLQPVTNVVMGVYHTINKNRVWLLVDAVPEFDKNGKLRQVVCTFNDITERKKTEEALFKSEQFLKETQQITQLGTYTLDISTGLWECSETLDTVFGIDAHFEKTVENWSLLNHPDWQQLMLDYFINEVIGKKQEFDKIYKIIRQNDKAERWVHGMGRLKYNEEGLPIQMIGTIRDVTERKMADEKIRETMILLEQTIKQSPVPMVLVGLPNQTLKMINNACLELLEIADEPSYINVSLKDVKPSWRDYDQKGNLQKIEETPIVRSLYGEKIENEERYVIRKDGSLRNELVSSFPIYDDAGSIIAAYAIFLDITERKKVEVALAESRHKFLKIFDRAPVLITITDIETGQYIDVNSYALSFSGYNRAEIIGRKSTEIGWMNVEGRSKMLETLKETGRIDCLELQFTTKGHKVVWGLVNGEIIELEKQKCLLTITTDITERKTMEFILKDKNIEIEVQNEEYLQLNEELTQTNEELYYAKEKAEESDRLKSAFLANMSHEIRTPMNGILGFTELLKEPQLSGDTRDTYIRIIEKSGNRMLNIINDIISISKVEAGQMDVMLAETNIIEQLDYIYTFFKPEVEQKGLQLICKKDYTKKEELIITDREKVYAILTNLVKNAIKFTLDGYIECGYEKTNTHLKFYVKDTGPGIPKEQHEIIFERFRQGSELLTRNYEGAGLGLAITKAYVDMLGGKIWVESQTGKGACFYFTLPLHTSKNRDIDAEYNTQISEETPQTVKGLKILIAEDDETSAELISLTVESISKVILKAKNGEEAVEFCRKNPDIDLILMDSKMPRIDGYEATRQIRKFNKDVVIIAQTAFALSGEREKALEAGSSDYITKPFSRLALLSLINTYCKK